MAKTINEILLFMSNNNLNYKDEELVSNFTIFFNDDYMPLSSIKNEITKFLKKDTDNFHSESNRFLALDSSIMSLNKILEELSYQMSIDTEEEEEYFNEEEEENNGIF